MIKMLVNRLFVFVSVSSMFLIKTMNRCVVLNVEALFKGYGLMVQVGHTVITYSHFGQVL